MTDPVPYSSPTPSADEEHLRILSICYYIWACLIAVGCLFGMLYMGCGLFFSAAGAASTRDGTGGIPGVLFMGIGGCITLFFAALAFAVFYAGRSLREHRRYVYCMVVAAFCCLSFPIGTVLGVFTFVVLGRPSVKALFTT